MTALAGSSTKRLVSLYRRIQPRSGGPSTPVRPGFFYGIGLLRCRCSRCGEITTTSEGQTSLSNLPNPNRSAECSSSRCVTNARPLASTRWTERAQTATRSDDSPGGRARFPRTNQLSASERSTHRCRAACVAKLRRRPWSAAWGDRVACRQTPSRASGLGGPVDR